MELNKNDKIKMLATLDLFKNKPELKEGEARESYPEPIMGGLSQLSMGDEEVLRRFAGLVFYHIKNYPKLMRELKEKYFKTL